MFGNKERVVTVEAVLWARKESVPPTEVSFSQLKELKSLNMLVQLV
jgi:hypothetical protein